MSLVLTAFTQDWIVIAIVDNFIYLACQMVLQFVHPSSQLEKFPKRVDDFFEVFIELAFNFFKVYFLRFILIKTFTL